jgi:hypothetical protein
MFDFDACLTLMHVSWVMLTAVLDLLQVQRLCSAMVSSKPPAGKEFDLQQEQIFFVKVGLGWVFSTAAGN